MPEALKIVFTFNQDQKSVKILFVTYADTESLLQNPNMESLVHDYCYYTGKCKSAVHSIWNLRH